jgi:SAM-dependent methyltransferase
MSSPPERIISLYQRFALEWDRERERSLLEKAWLDRFLALLPLNPSILDMGCGSGEPIARYFIEKRCAMTGIDSSPSLIGMCKARFPEQNWIATGMRSLSLDRLFDGILAWNSFFHLCPDDQRKMFPIFRRHVASKAALMFTSGPSYGEAIGTYKGKSLYHGSLDEAEYRLLLNQNGFDVVSHVVEDPDCGYQTVWLAQLRSICSTP